MFAPLEEADAEAGEPAAEPVIAMYDADTLALVGVKHFPGTQFRAGWVAINPVDGLLYSGDQGAAIHVYEWRGESTVLDHLYTLDLPPGAPGFAGGNGLAFSDSGHLYGVSAPDEWWANPVYLYIYHVVGRAVRFEKSVLLAEDFDFWEQNKVEGIDVMRADLMGNAHPQLTGDVHIVFWNHDAFSPDNWTFLNVEVDDPSLL